LIEIWKILNTASSLSHDRERDVNENENETKKKKKKKKMRIICRYYRPRGSTERCAFKPSKPRARMCNNIKKRKVERGRVFTETLNRSLKP
jgi:hypothetical protein